MIHSRFFVVLRATWLLALMPLLAARSEAQQVTVNPKNVAHYEYSPDKDNGLPGGVDPTFDMKLTWFAPKLLGQDLNAPITVSASPDETLTFGAEFEDSLDTRTPILKTGTPGTSEGVTAVGPYSADWTISGAAEFGAGTGNKTLLNQPVQSGATSPNYFLHILSSWTGTPITVNLVIHDNVTPPAAPDTGSAKDADIARTWTISPRGNNVPTLIKTISPIWTDANHEWPLNPYADFTMQASGNNTTGTRPFFYKQTMQETWATPQPISFSFADVIPAYAAAHNLTAANAFNFLINSPGQGTFVFDSNDSTVDEYGGFLSAPYTSYTGVFTPSALQRGISYQQQQTYSAAGNTLGQETNTFKLQGTSGIPTLIRQGS